MAATAQGLCEFIDASPSPFHVCATVASRLSAAGYTELAEADEWPQAGKFFTVRAASLVAWDSGNDAGGRPLTPFASWVAGIRARNALLWFAYKVGLHGLPGPGPTPPEVPHRYT